METALTLRIHSLVPRSRVAGPGVRFLIHTQGCTLGCPGCFNPATHDLAGGGTRLVSDLAQSVAAVDDIEGITVSGGEPLQQAPALAELLKVVQAAGLSVILYSGYTLPEIELMPVGRQVLSLTDVLIDGPYRRDEPCRDGYRGSLNQRVRFLTSRYGPSDFPPQPAPVEAEIAPDGAVTLRGFPDEALRRALGALLRPAGEADDKRKGNKMK